ncbi:MAG: hypothetical protein LCH41_12590 [Armatimonadetes bacterium]|nr:hypothetical protein [Armatimonadota bacterium]
MKRSLTTIIVLVAALAMSATSFAQNAGPRGGGGQGQAQGQGQRGPGMFRGSMEEVKKIHQKVLKQLKLTDAQTKAVAAADKKRDAAMAKMRDSLPKGGGRPNEEQMKKLQAQGKKISETYRADMEKAMGKAKWAEYQKLMRAEMEKMMKERQGKGAGGGKGKSGGGTIKP